MILRKVFFLLLLFFHTLYALESVEFGLSNGDLCRAQTPPQSYKKIPKYTLQVVSTKSIKSAQKLLKKLPKNLRRGTKLYKSGCYIAARFSKADKATELQKYIKAFKKYGFKDAYIIKTTKWHMINNLIKENTHITEANKGKKPQNTQSKNQSLQIQKHSLSKYKKSNMLLKADKAYKSGDESLALIYYEMLVHSGAATRKIKNNLCYLYGKRGDFEDAKKLIDKEKYTSELLYAYAYGALETNQNTFMQDLSQSIMFDKSGRLALLAASYYEQKNDLQRALSYYKLAYEKNRSDVYNIFAYARALDMKKKYNEAIKYYKKALQHTNKNQQIYDIIKNRISQLKG